MVRTWLFTVAYLILVPVIRSVCPTPRNVNTGSLLMYSSGRVSGSSLSHSWTGYVTRKLCCRKETARCPVVRLGSKFADNIHTHLRSSQASKAMFQSSKHTGANQNLTQNDHSRSSKVTCTVLWRQLKGDQGLSNNILSRLLRFRRLSIGHQ